MNIAGFDIDLGGLQLLPGMINAHDHLEFSLFPRLGPGPHPNATAWAREVYRPDEPPIREHRRVEKRIRLLWGGLKNLISGVTTVCHHNPYDALFDEPEFPVRVVKDFGWAHSLHFSPDLAERFRATPPESPFIIHAGEGVDEEAHREIVRLHDLGMLDRRIVLVHAVALDEDGIELARHAGASIVWCPSSNLFTLGRTLSEEILHSGILIALGTDSALTGHGDILDELCLASRLAAVDVKAMVQDAAARILRLPATSDAIAVREFGAPPELVVVRDRIRLISPALAEQLPKDARAGFHSLQVEGRPPVLVSLDIADLNQRTRAVLGDDIHVAGRRVLQ